ncbi:MAG TPA: hypothetical protein VL866_13765 [Pyrinomonadaceae bacterium]|nr:hypothetical protein [Pyrinomonadaceae bacterium]
MKQKRPIKSALRLIVSIYVGLIWALVASADVQSVNDKQAVKVFESEVQEYVKLRNRVRENVPKLPKEATPEQIHTFMMAFQDATRAARSGAKPGEIFKPAISEAIRATLKNHFRGEDRVELRKTVFEAENKSVPLRVNYPYPQSKEYTEMPPKLLLELPQLPKELRYRFVGRNMLLMDRENNLIVDYMVNALP